MDETVRLTAEIVHQGTETDQVRAETVHLKTEKVPAFEHVGFI